MFNFQIGKVIHQIATATEPGAKIAGPSGVPDDSDAALLSQGFSAILARFFPEPTKVLEDGSSATGSGIAGKTMVENARPDRVAADESPVAIRPSGAEEMKAGETHLEHASEPETDECFFHIATKHDPATKGASETALAAGDVPVPSSWTPDSSANSDASDYVADMSFGPAAASWTAEWQNRPDVETLGQAPTVIGQGSKAIPSPSFPQADPESGHHARAAEPMTERGFPLINIHRYDAESRDGRMAAQEPARSKPPTLPDRHMQEPHQAHGVSPAPNVPSLGVSDRRRIAGRAPETPTTSAFARPDVPRGNDLATPSKQTVVSLPETPRMAPVFEGSRPSHNAPPQGGVETETQFKMRTGDIAAVQMAAVFVQSTVSESMGVVAENRALDMASSALPNVSRTGQGSRSDDISRPPQPEAHNSLLRTVEPVPSVPEMGTASAPRRLMASDVGTAAERPPQFDTTLPQRSIGRDTVAPMNAAPVETDSLNRQQNPANMAAIAPGNGTRAPIAELPHSYGPAPRMDAPITSAAAPLMPVTQPRQASAPTQNPGAVALVPQSRTGEASIGQPVERGELDLVQRPDTVRFATGQLVAEASALPRPGHPGQPAQADLPRHVAQQIVTALRSGGDMASELYLSPSELGRVRISLSSSDLGMVVSIIADRPETLELMRRHADQLARDFHDIGYQAAEFSFGQGAPDHAHDERKQDDRPDLHDMGAIRDMTRARNGPVLAAGVALDRLDLRI